MGKYFGLVVIGALLLTGCAAGEPEAAAPTVTVTATPDAAAIEAAPSDTNTADDENSPGVFGNPKDDDFFIKSAKPALVGVGPADAELVGAAKLACEQMGAGSGTSSVSVISGVDPDSDAHNNAVIGQYAAQIYCPQ